MKKHIFIFQKLVLELLDSTYAWCKQKHVNREYLNWAGPYFALRYFS